MALSPAQAAILAAAQQHAQHLVAPPPKLALAPRDAIRKNLLAKDLIEPGRLRRRTRRRRGRWTARLRTTD